MAPVEYYILLNSGSHAVIEQFDNYIKQTYRNRTVIASANGLQTLSIPIVKPSSHKCLTKDIRIADHDNWRHLHWQAIVSAYNSTPFFEYYEDDFLPFFKKDYDFLFDFNELLRIKICELLDINPSVSYSTEYVKDLDSNISDYREAIHPKKPSLMQSFKPYYQVFEQRYGFQANISILDLLFNMGPEASLLLSK